MVVLLVNFINSVFAKSTSFPLLPSDCIHRNGFVTSLITDRHWYAIMNMECKVENVPVKSLHANNKYWRVFVVKLLGLSYVHYCT